MPTLRKLFGPNSLPSFRSRFSLREEKPVVIPDFDLPRPDFSVVRGSFREYATRHPTPEDVLLLIEISDSTLAKDRYKKLPIYARARIPLYWIINLVHRQVEIYSLRRRPGYGKPKIYRSPQSFPVILEKESLGQISVDALFPRE